MPRLRLLQIDVTEECPLACSHCSNCSGPRRSQRFPISQLIPIVIAASEMGVETVVYSGGEPLRYPDLADALEAATAAGVETILFTTGIRDLSSRHSISLQEWLDLRERGLSCARFSVYSGPTNREFHNTIVGLAPDVGDAFGVNEQGILCARRAGIEVEVHFVPCEATAGELLEVYAWAKESGCRKLHLQAPTVQGRNRLSKSLSLGESGEAELREAASHLRGTLDPELCISRFWLHDWGILNLNTGGCPSSEGHLIIRSDGTVSPCNACKYRLDCERRGNVLTEGVPLLHKWADGEVFKELDLARRTGLTPSGCSGVIARDL